MSTITLDLPEHLARYAADQNDKNPGWLEMLVRKAAERTPAKPAACSAAAGSVAAEQASAASAATPAPPPFDRALEFYKQGGWSIAGAAEAAGPNRTTSSGFSWASTTPSRSRPSRK